MTTTVQTPTLSRDRRAVRILARSLARELTTEGFDASDLIALASELIGEAAQRMRAARTQLTAGDRR